MAIDRQNIFNLIGNDSRKYHSCYITTYSFDFLFFEERVLPALKRAGIINVNLFVDGKIFQQKITDSIGINKKVSRGYSINPIDINGAFHPKLFIAIGKKKGMFAIGSGNITSSGINSNEEIWSAFHLTEENDVTSPLFFKVKEYLMDLSKSSYGFNLSDKLNWLSSNSPWFENLSNDRVPPQVEYKDSQFEVITSNADTSLYRNILERLPKNPQTIKIIAPYHNKNGLLIQNLLDDLDPVNIHCVVDPLYGTIPYEFEHDSKVEFTDWNQIQEDSRIRRLHAKIFQFGYENETYLVFGSANASIEAFGNRQNNSSNSEAIVFVRSKNSIDWLKKLEINIPDKGIYDLSSYIPQQDETESKSNYHKCLDYAEIEGAQLLLTFNENISEANIDIIIMDSGEKILHKINSHLKKSPVLIEVPEDSVREVFKTALFKGEKRYSNFVFIHHIDAIRRTNPDTHKARLNALINSETFSDLELEEILEYVNFRKSSSSSSSSNKKEHSSDLISENTIPEAISEEEFNKNEGVYDKRKKSNDELEILEEFLFEISQNDKDDQKKDFKESSESVAIDSNIDGGVIDESFEIKDGIQRVSFAQGKKLKKKLERVVNQITSRIKEHKKAHLKSWRLRNEYGNKASMEDLKSILVGVHLIMIKKNDCFYENRSVVCIRIVDRNSKRRVKLGDKEVRVDTMDLLKDIESKLNLERYKGSVSSMDEVAYTINENNIEKLKTELKIIPELKLIYHDESPSQIVDHHYFNTTVWQEEIRAKSVEHFMLEGLGSLIRLINSGEEDFDELEFLRWKRYKKRLLYQSIVIVESFKWKKNIEHMRDLMELNLFYSLVKNELSVSEFKQDMSLAIEKAKDKGYQGEIDIIRLINLFKRYNKWISIYINEPSNLKEKLDFISKQKIVFNRTLGFAMVDHVFGDFRVNLVSPLGSYDAERKIYGFANVVLGPKTMLHLKVDKRTEGLR